MEEKKYSQRLIAYQKRPKWTYLVAAAFMLAPLGNLIFTLRAFGVERWWDPAVWWIWVLRADLWALLLQFLIFFTGLALLAVRNWSWTFALGTLSGCFLFNTIFFDRLMPLGKISLVIMFFVTLTFGGLLLFSPFRRPYLNPRLRWWETQKRFRADIKAILEGVPVEANLVDVSRTGALIEWPGTDPIPDLSGNQQITLTHGPILSCQIVRRTERGYGLMFSNISKESQRYLKNWIAELSKNPDRFAR